LVASAIDRYLSGGDSCTIWVHRVEDDMSDFEVETEEHEGHTVLRPRGDIDAYSVGQFREALSGLAEEPRLLIDLSEVPFMDSAGLGALIGGIRRNRDHDGEIVVVCDKPALTRLLHTTGFDRIVPVTETLETGVATILGDDAPDTSG
jgi:anti-sigma B factor antagonist